MIYHVTIIVQPDKGPDLSISKRVSIEEDEDRNLFKHQYKDGCWTYGETAQELAIRVATEDWTQTRA